MADAVSKGRMRRGESCHLSRLTEEDVRQVRHLRMAGFPYAAIEAVYGIKPPAISWIVNHKSWKHVKGVECG